jgi:ubiquinone/menaquinone biosynthesis C-methylase UbiE
MNHPLQEFTDSCESADTLGVATEYKRRSREIPRGFYSLGNPAHLLMYQQTYRSCIRMLQRGSLFPLHNRRIADIGCSDGAWLLDFVQWGADPSALAGIDLLPDRLQGARKRIPQADFHVGNAAQLPWADESFDLASQFLVFNNIFDDQLKRAIAQEMLRIVRPGGGILWFDLRVNNPFNPRVRGLRAKEIRSLFPGCRVDLKPVLLAPPIARLVAPVCWSLGEFLHSIPLLLTHYVGLIRKPERTGAAGQDNG